MTYTGYLATTNYSVTIAINAPIDYTALPGNSGGGVDNCSADKYNRKVSITGTTHNPTVTAAHSIFINNTEIVFTGGNLAQTITDINSKTATSAHPWNRTRRMNRGTPYDAFLLTMQPEGGQAVRTILLWRRVSYRSESKRRHASSRSASVLA